MMKKEDRRPQDVRQLSSSPRGIVPKKQYNINNTPLQNNTYISTVVCRYYPSTTFPHKLHCSINILSIICILLIYSPIIIVLVPILHIPPNDSKRDFHYHQLQNLNNNKLNITIDIDNDAKASILQDIKSQAEVDVDVGVKYNVCALLRRLMREPNVKRENKKKKKCPKAKKKGKVNRITSKEYNDFVTKVHRLAKGFIW
jgi:hypothetical protein